MKSTKLDNLIHDSSLVVFSVNKNSKQIAAVFLLNSVIPVMGRFQVPPAEKAGGHPTIQTF